MIQLVRTFSSRLEYSVVYVKTGNIENNIMRVYSNIEHIPSLGYLLSGSHCDESYLISPQDESIIRNDVLTDSGEHIYSIFPSQNPNTIIFYPSGFYDNKKFMIHGQVSLLSKNKLAKEMYATIRKTIKSQFSNKHGWYIGEEAMHYYGKIRFVTIDVNEPEEYDLN